MERLLVDLEVEPDLELCDILRTRGELRGRDRGTGVFYCASCGVFFFFASFIDDQSCLCVLFIKYIRGDLSPY